MGKLTFAAELDKEGVVVSIKIRIRWKRQADRLSLLLRRVFLFVTLHPDGGNSTQSKLSHASLASEMHGASMPH